MHIDELTVLKILEKLIKVQSAADTREDRQRVGHILEIVKKNPQLRQIRDQLRETEG